MLVELGGHRPKILGTDHFIAENATLIGDVTLHNETSVWYNAVIRADMDSITIGQRSNVQDGAVLHTDPGLKLVVGDGVTVGHKAVLHGCNIGDHALIGINSVVLNGARIGKHSIVGANTLIPEGKEYEDGVLIVGTPGRVVRSLEASEIEALSQAFLAYTSKIAKYKQRKVVAINNNYES